MSACPLRVASILWQPRAGAWALTVACKATFTLAPGESPPAMEHEAPSQADFYWDNDERRSLYLATDLAPFKRRADVILVGSACAPGRHPVGSLLTRLRVGEIDKAIAVFGDRLFTRNGDLLAPAPFVRMPLQWERAGGGPGTTNPVGVSPNATPDVQGRSPVPNLQPPGAYIAHRNPVEPMGFGPIPPIWPSRMQKLLRHAARWNHRRWHEQPLPDDIDAGYFNAAPLDQQGGEIRPDERITLENLHPDHPCLVTQLRALVPRARVERDHRPAQEIKLRCDTLWIDTDRGTCSLTWRGCIPLEHPHQAGRVVIWLPEGARLSWLPAPQTGYERAAEAAPDPGKRGEAPAPFGLRSPDWKASETTLNSSLTAASLKPVLPFVESQTPGAASPSIEPAPDSAPAPMTLPAAGAKHSDSAGRAMPETQPSPLHDGLPFVAMGAAAGSMMQAPTAAVMPPSPSPIPPSAIPSLPPLSIASAPPLPPEPDLPEQEPQAPILIAKPPMIGPLAMLDTTARPEAKEPSPLSPAPADRPENVEPEEALGPKMEEFPMERFAAIRASLALRPGDKEMIFRANGLTDPAWARLRSAWDAEIKGALRRGRSQMLRAFDAAYVVQLEKERGPLSVDEVARITVWTERGNQAEALREAGLPDESGIHILRTWIGRIASDPALGAAMRKAAEKARAAE